MKVLVFSSVSTAEPRSGDGQRLWAICKRLQLLGHSIHFMHFDSLERLTGKQAESMRADWDSFYYVPSQKSQMQLQMMTGSGADDLLQATVGLHVSLLADSLCPDAVICNHAQFSKVLEHVNDAAVRILEAQRTVAQAEQPAGSAHVDMSELSTVTIEARQLRRADIIIAPQESESARLRSITTKPVVTISQIGEKARASANDTAKGEEETLVDESFDRLFASRETLLKAAGGGEPEVAARRNTAARTVMIATHARFWRPGFGSHLRIRQLVEELSRPYRLVVFCTCKLEPSDETAIAAMALPVEIIGLNKNYDLFSGPASAERLLGQEGDGEILSSFKEAVKRIRPSVCIVEYLRLSFLLPALPRHTVRIIDTHDLISRRQESLETVRAGVPVNRLDELKALSHYDYMMMIQRTEMSVVDTWGFQGRILYVPPHFTAATSEAAKPRRGTVGFIGAATDANYDALAWFLEYVWPFFWQRNLELRIAGSVGNRLSAPPPSASILGHVEIDEFYNSIDIAINPAQWGGGLKIKTVEALSRGVPIITTTEGAAGLEEADGRGLVIADDATSFALALNLWLTNEEERLAQAGAAQAFIREEFAQDVVFSDLHMIIQSTSPVWQGRGHRGRGNNHA